MNPSFSLGMLPLLLSGGPIERAERLAARGEDARAVTVLERAVRRASPEERPALERALDEAWWAMAQDSVDAIGFQAYLAVSPEGAHVEQARRALCVMAFRDAGRAATGTSPSAVPGAPAPGASVPGASVPGAAASPGRPEPWLAFAREHADCPERAAALDHAATAALFAARGDAAALRRVAAEHPGTEQARAALLEVSTLAYEQARAAPGSAALVDWLRTYPRDPRAPEARALAADRAWAEARDEGTSDAVAAFLRDHPGSDHEDEARAFLARRGEGLLRVDGDTWTAISSGPWSPGELVYKAPAGGSPPAALEIRSLVKQPGGVGASAVAMPLGRWAAGWLGVDPALLETPRLPAKPGARGETRFAVPFELGAWSWGGAAVVGYELRVLDPAGGELAVARVGASAGGLPLSVVRAGGTAAWRALEARRRDPSALVALAAVRLLDDDLAGARRAWAEAREAWPGLPETPPGLADGAHVGALYAAEAGNPGSSLNGFVGLASATPGGVRMLAAGKGEGALLSADGLLLGSATVGQGGAAARFDTPRTAFHGVASWARGVDAASLASPVVFLVTPAARARGAGGGWEPYLARWPGLRAALGADPGAWARKTVEGLGGGPPLGPYDLDGDGLPELLSRFGTRLEVVSVGAEGGTSRRPTDAAPTGTLAVAPVATDLDGDGNPELLVTSAARCGGLGITMVRVSRGNLVADDLSLPGRCEP